MMKLAGIAAILGCAPIGGDAGTSVNASMYVENDGTVFASAPYTFALSGGDTVKPDFLSRARKYQSPEVTEIVVRLALTASGVTGGALGRDAAKLVKRIKFRDDAEMIDLSGSSIRVLEQIDFGSKQLDPADIASGATVASSGHIIQLRISFDPPNRAHRGRDFHVPLVNFLDGGEFQYQFADALPTGWSTVSGSMRFFFRVKEGRNKEGKARRKLTEVSYNRDDDHYITDGGIRGLYLTSLLTTTAHTALTGITTVNSVNLELPADLPTSILVDRYRRNADSLATTDEVILGNVIPFVAPDKGQKIGAMPILKAAHIKVGSTPTSGILIRDVLVERPLGITAMQMGYADPGEYARDLLARGTVSDGKTNKRITDVPADLARIMPFRLDRSPRG